jgi:PAS domain S-box-containing protein
LLILLEFFVAKQVPAYLLNQEVGDMNENELLDVKITDDVGKFAETYSSFNKIINKLNRQYLALQETYTQQSQELSSVNETLQALMKENRVVTEFLNSILNSLNSGVIAVDRFGKVSHMNPAAKKILGIDDESLENRLLDYEEVMLAVENDECSALRAMKESDSSISGEKKVRTRYNTVLTLSVSTSLLLNRSGEVVGAVELFQDVSKLKAIEDQLSQMKVLASLGEMAASIAHEVRNPLVGIGGFASLLARDLENDPDKRNMAKKIVEGVESINQTIQTLTDFARKEKVEKSSVFLNTYLTHTIGNFSGEFGIPDLNNKLDVKLPGDVDIKVALDRRLFKQAFSNLVKNGLDACRSGEKPLVKIRTRIIPIEKAQSSFKNRIELSGTETVSEITIEDNGPGIPQGDIDKLFSPFYSTKENGMGLGLSIAWKIIKVHGGDIFVESKTGQGTKFTILLPIESAQ